MKKKKKKKVPILLWKSASQVKREKIFFLKLNIKDDNVFNTDIYTIAIKIFTRHKKSLKKYQRSFNRENF